MKEVHENTQYKHDEGKHLIIVWIVVIIQMDFQMCHLQTIHVERYLIILQSLHSIHFMLMCSVCTTHDGTHRTNKELKGESTVWFQVNPRSAIPMYQQVIDGIKSAVAKGLLQPGEKLPSVRELALELTINHNTVVKAYTQLERDDVIEVVRGRGTFIALEPTVPNAEVRLKELRATLSRLVIEAHHLRLRDEEFIDMVRQVLEELHGDSEGGVGGHDRNYRD